MAQTGPAVIVALTQWTGSGQACVARDSRQHLTRVIRNWSSGCRLRGRRTGSRRSRERSSEELRTLGLLGQKTSPGDLRVKYPTGMIKHEVVEELKNFLTGTHETLSFPPMDNHARKLVHELASRFRVKSKSTGKADERRPTLHRMARTLPYVESTSEQAAARIYRPYLPRTDAKGKRGPSKTASARGSYAAASYRDGEVVGAAAPELGTGNRGRATLEKMGWSSGTALGATHKGILQPVTRTMKRSKAGLG